MNAVLPRLRLERFLFSAVVTAVLACVIIGFWPSYFAPGLIFAKLPSFLVHLHGALFVGWIVLLVVQTSLITSGKVALHRRLGVLGAVLAPLMVIIAILTLISSVQRHSVPDLPPAVLLAGDLLQLLFFCIFVAWGLRARRVAAKHKRLMLFATMCVLAPALSRWPFDFIQPTGVFVAVYCAFPLTVLTYDFLTLRRVHRVTAWGLALFVVMLAGMFTIPALPAWQRFTDFVVASPRIPI